MLEKVSVLCDDIAWITFQIVLKKWLMRAILRLHKRVRTWRHANGENHPVNADRVIMRPLIGLCRLCALHNPHNLIIWFVGN